MSKARAFKAGRLSAALTRAKSLRGSQFHVAAPLVELMENAFNELRGKGCGLVPDYDVTNHLWIHRF